MKKESRPDRDDIIHVASSCEMTGFEPTPPLTNDEEDAYATLGNVPAPHSGEERRGIPRDPCGGGARNQ